MADITGSAKTNIFSRRILTQASLKDHLLDFIDARTKRSFKMMTTGVSADDDPGGFFQPCTVVDGTGSSLTFGAMYGTDGTGECFDLATSAPSHLLYCVNVPFEDTTSTVYHLAAKQVDLGQGISFDSTTGIYGIDRYQKVIGQHATPTTITDNGDGTLTIDVSLIDSNDNYTARTAVVYLKTPVDPSETTAYETVTFSGAKKITNVGNLGQTSGSASTNPADYEVVVLGPVVTQQDISPDAPGNAGAGYAYIGSVTGGSAPRAYDTSEQDLITPLTGIEDRLEEFVSNGWLDAPTGVIIGGTTFSWVNTGVAFVSGSIVPVPSATFDFTSYADGEYVMVWSPAGGIEALNNLSAAISGNRLICGYATWTSGTGTLTGSATFQRIKTFNKQVQLTVSGGSANAAAFRSIKEALTWCAAYKTAVPYPDYHTRQFTIRLIGHVHLGGVIDENELLEIPNVRFIGEGSADNGDFMSLLLVENMFSSTYDWNSDGGLAIIDLDDANHFASYTGTDGVCCVKWQFENITFVSGTGATDPGALISINGDGVGTNLKFKGCAFGLAPVVSTSPTRKVHNYLVQWEDAQTTTGFNRTVHLDGCSVFCGLGLVYIDPTSTSGKLWITASDVTVIPVGGTPGLAVTNPAMLTAPSMVVRLNNVVYDWPATMVLYQASPQYEGGVSIIHAAGGLAGVIRDCKFKWARATQMDPGILGGSTTTGVYEANQPPEWNLTIDNTYFQDWYVAAAGNPTNHKWAAAIHLYFADNPHDGGSPLDHYELAQTVITKCRFGSSPALQPTNWLEDSPAIIFEATSTGEGSGGWSVKDCFFSWPIGFQYVDGTGQTAGAEHGPGHVCGNQMVVLKRGILLDDIGRAYGDTRDLHGIIIANNSIVIHNNDVADAAADPAIGIQSLGMPAVVNGNTIALMDNENGAAIDFLGSSLSDGADHSVIFGNAIFGGETNAAVGNHLQAGPQSVVLGNVIGESWIDCSNESVAVGNLSSSAGTTDTTANGATNVTWVGNYLLGAGSWTFDGASDIVLVGNNSTAAGFGSSGATQDVVVMGNIFNNFEALNGSGVVFGGNIIEADLHAYPVAAGSEDHKYLENSAVFGNVVDDFGEPTNQKKVFVHQCAVFGNYGDNMYINRPTDEGTGDGTGGPSGTSAIVGNVSDGNFYSLMEKTSFVGNIMSANALTTATRSLDGSVKFRSFVNGGSAGGTIASDDLLILGNQIAGPISTDFLTSMMGNQMWGYVSADPFSSGSTHTASWFIDTAAASNNFIQFGNLLDNGWSHSGTVSTPTLAGLAGISKTGDFWQVF